ncbi:MAG: dihydrofolate reductase family protein [Vampirovibrionales bacterium]
MNAPLFYRCVACFASSVDGKITAPPDPNTPDAWVKLGTPADLNRLFRLRDSAEVLCFGDSTFRAWASVRRGLTHQADASLTPPLHVLFTQSWAMDWQAPCFVEWQTHRKSWSPFFVASTNPPPADLPAEISSILHPILLDATHTPAQQLQAVKTAVDPFLKNAPTATWMLEGGGQLFDFFLQAHAVNELHLTLTPQLIGGISTPSLVGGAGFSPVSWATVAWTSVEHHPPELFLVGDVVYTFIKH